MTRTGSRDWHVAMSRNVMISRGLLPSGSALGLERFRVRRLVFPRLRQHWHLCRMNLDGSWDEQ